MSHKILITGGSGLVGTQLTQLLLSKGYAVAHIGRSSRAGRLPSVIWDVENGKFDLQALQGVDTIVHLAGAGVADKRWTEKRKKEILDSRIQSTELLWKVLKEGNHSVKAVVSASAIGYYGFGMGEEIVDEESKPGTDFLAQVTKLWEQESDKISALGIRVVKIRIGIVLSDKGGALVEMAKPIRLGIGAALGTGKQYMSWIHLDDLCEMFARAVNDSQMVGAYNAVAPGWVTNAELTKAIARILKMPLLLPPIPAFMMKIIVGEMAVIILNGSKVSSTKIQQLGFKFKYLSLDEALTNLLTKD